MQGGCAHGECGVRNHGLPQDTPQSGQTGLSSFTEAKRYPLAMLFRGGGAGGATLCNQAQTVGRIS